MSEVAGGREEGALVEAEMEVEEGVMVAVVGAGEATEAEVVVPMACPAAQAGGG